MAKCSQCDGCGRCEGRGAFEGFILGTILGVFCMSLLLVPDGDDLQTCREACEAIGHFESAFDLQRGCVCSDPYPEVPEPTREWVQP